MSTTLHANPGGKIPTSQIVGRDDLTRTLWRILDRQSLVLSAERRIGKTSLMHKMIAERKDSGHLMVYRDLEKIRTRLEFVEDLLRDVEEHLSKSQKRATRARQLLGQLGGAEIKVLGKLPEIAAPHWKSLLTSTLDDLMEQDQPVFFFWDEFSLFLHNVREAEGVGAATEILDVLRALRQTHAKLRMVLTGSIGVLNVIGSLKRAGYANDPLNDAYKMIVPPLSREHAVELARRLLIGESVAVDDLDAVAEKIAVTVDHLPYYIHHVVDRFASHQSEVDPNTVEEVVTRCLTDPVDPWDLQHYLDRVPTYYSEEHQPIALGLLDALANSPGPLDFESLFNGLKSSVVTEDRETARSVLKMLEYDHYVMLEEKKYRFVFPLIQRWWVSQRG